MLPKIYYEVYTQDSEHGGISDIYTAKHEAWAEYNRRKKDPVIKRVVFNVVITQDEHEK